MKLQIEAGGPGWLRRAAIMVCVGVLAGCANPLFSNSFSTYFERTPPLDDSLTNLPVEPTASADDPGYLIGPEDALEIAVWKDETLKSSTLVRPDGGISFPLAGDLIVAGKTATQVRDELVKRLDKFIPEPVVTVSVVRVSSYRVYVLGRVNKPGDYALGRRVDVLQALTLAGGMTPFAVEERIRIIRRVDGRNVAIPFDYSRVRKGSDLSQNITLKSGDVLLVP